MDNIAGQKSSLGIATHLATLALVILWIVPTIGLLSRRCAIRTRSPRPAGGARCRARRRPIVVTVPVEDQMQAGRRMACWRPTSSRPAGRGKPAGGHPRPPGRGRLRHLAPARPDHSAGPERETRGGVTVTVEEDGTLVATSPEPMEEPLGLPMALLAPPQVTLENYAEVLTDMSAEERAEARGIGQRLDDMLFSDEALFGPFVNTLTVSIPATIIPIVIAAFAAYALAWMDFPGRGLLIAIVVGLLVVPLQLAFVPLTIIHSWFGIGKSFLGIWLAHTGFGLPLAVYLLAQLHGRPAARHHRERQGGRRDGFRDLHQDRPAAEFPGARQLRHLPVPLDLERPAGGLVFLPADTESTVMTRFVVTNLLGSRGGSGTSSRRRPS